MGFYDDTFSIYSGLISLQVMDFYTITHTVSQVKQFGWFYAIRETKYITVIPDSMHNICFVDSLQIDK